MSPPQHALPPFRPSGTGHILPWETPSTLVTAKGMFVTLVFQGKTGAVRLPGDRQLGVGSPSQPRRGPREPSSADTSPRRLRAPPAHPASHGLPPAGPGVCSFGRPLPHLSSMRMRCPPEPTKCRDWKHKQEIEEGPPQAQAEQASSLPVGPRPGGAVCVLCPRGEGQQGAGHVPPRTADLPGALVTACASICPPRGQASCIIQAPWRGPRERALTRADWPDRVSRQRTLDEQGVCPLPRLCCGHRRGREQRGRPPPRARGLRGPGTQPVSAVLLGGGGVRRPALPLAGAWPWCGHCKLGAPASASSSVTWMRQHLLPGAGG